MRNKTLKQVLILVLTYLSVASCLAQTKPETLFDSLKLENMKLRTKLKEVPVAEVLQIFAMYEQQVKNCEAAKADILQASTNTLQKTNTQLATVQAELSTLKAENQALNALLNTVQTNLQESLKLQKKARRKIFFERVGTVVLSSAATLVVASVLR